MTLLSIITINYNDIVGLERTIKSVQSQTIQDFEHIIIDGNSDDGSKELIQNTQENYSYWISENDNGIYDAMNKGVARASGEYILFLNSGDNLSHSNALQDMSKHLGFTDFVYANINVKGGDIDFIKECPDKLSFRYLYDDVPPHQATFTRRAMFKKYGNYDISLKIVADWKFFILAVCKYNASYQYVDTTFSNFYVGGVSSKIVNRQLMEHERNIVLEKEFPVFLQDIKEHFVLERIIRNLRESGKIKLLQQLGILDKF